MPKNGKLTAIMATVIGGLLVLAVVGVFHTRDLGIANAQTITTNAGVCEEHRADTKGMPIKVAVIESTVSKIEEHQREQSKKLDALLAANGVKVGD